MYFSQLSFFIIFSYDYKHLPLSNRPQQPEMNFIENKYLPGLLMSCPGLLHIFIEIFEKIWNFHQIFMKYKYKEKSYLCVTYGPESTRSL